MARVIHKELWHYISTDFVSDQTKKDGVVYPDIPFYWDQTDPYNGVQSVAFLPTNKTDVNKVLKHLGLKSATWRNTGQQVYATGVTPLTPVKPKKADTIAMYVEARKKTPEAAILQEKRNLTKFREHAKTYLSSLTSTYEKIHESQHRLELLANTNGQEEEFKAEIATILKLEKVKMVGINGNTLTIHTDMIGIQDVPLGEFKFTIDLQTGHIGNIVNKTPIAAGYGDYYHHPHVTGRKDTGGPCWGNISGMIADHAAKRDIPMIVTIVLEWLATYNTDRGGYGGIFGAFKRRNEKKEEKKDPAVAKEVKADGL